MGNDLAGQFIRDESVKLGFNTSKWLFLDKVSTGSYSAIFDPTGELIIGCGDMRAHSYISPQLIEQNKDNLINSEMVVIDADIPRETIDYICNLCFENKVPIWFNPTDIRKCTKVVETNNLSKLTFISPNLKELITIFENTLRIDTKSNDKLKQMCTKYSNDLNANLEHLQFDDLKQILRYLLDYVPFIVLSRGSKDLLFASRYCLDLNDVNQLPTKQTIASFRNRTISPVLFNFPVLKLEDNETFVNVSGAGDSCSSGIISGIVNNYTLGMSVYNGLLAAKMSLMTRNNVSNSLDSISLKHLEQIVDLNENEIKRINLIE